MKKYVFKTNINCGGCVAKVTPLFNENPAIVNWHVNTEVPEKILTIETAELSPDEIQLLIESKGFDAEIL